MLNIFIIYDCSNSKQQGLVAEYLYPCLAGERSLMKGKGWPNEKKNVVKIINNTNMVNQEELDAVNWMVCLLFCLLFVVLTRVANHVDIFFLPSSSLFFIFANNEK